MNLLEGVTRDAEYFNPWH